MRWLASAIVVLLAVSFVAADEKPKANTLTAKEAAAGWLLLFDGETTFGWRVDGDVKVENGVLVLGGDKKTTVHLDFGTHEMVWDYQVQGKQVNLHMSYYRGKNQETGQNYILEPDKKDVWRRHLFRFVTDPKAKGVKVEEVVQNPADGVDFRETENSYLPGRHIHNVIEVPAKSKLLLSNVKLRPIQTKSLFNGKDLTGWKEFPDRKSQFSVDKDGYLNIQNGPGDLQTKDEWADFILQLDCRTNGDGLNSGVFFRCQPDKYQQGYEAQIHNKFTEKADKEYAIDEYDPKTNKLTETKKEKYQAVDYGTGAIYRRIPARKPVAVDKEWFTMTVYARGRRIMVWVNGYPVTDWIDNRPANDNARNGCRLEKGPISLQGHDPTTDLSFRNFKIVEIAQGGPAK